MLDDTIAARHRAPHFVHVVPHRDRSAAPKGGSGTGQQYSHAPVSSPSSRGSSGLPAKWQSEGEGVLKDPVEQLQRRRVFSGSGPQPSISL